MRAENRSSAERVRKLRADLDAVTAEASDTTVQGSKASMVVKGSKGVKASKPKFRSFDNAHAFVVKLSLNSSKAWQLYVLAVAIDLALVESNSCPAAMHPH